MGAKVLFFLHLGIVSVNKHLKNVLKVSFFSRKACFLSKNTCKSEKNRTFAADLESNGAKARGCGCSPPPGKIRLYI